MRLRKNWIITEVKHMALLEVKGLTKSFGSVQVLKSIDFTLERGEVLTIIGSSGSGKTTLLRCLNFLEKPDGGTITVDGELLFGGNAEKETEAAIREKRLKFGMVFQSFNLFPQYTVMENLTLAPILRLREEKRRVSREDRATIVNSSEALLRQVGLLDKRDSYPFQLSGGQQQRVAIARALALQPEILCFDEPTSALDPELTGEVLKVIRSLKGGDRTMIVVTHEMEFARQVSDKVIFMSEGYVVETGTPEQVFGNPQQERTKAFLAKRELDG